MKKLVTLIAVVAFSTILAMASTPLKSNFTVGSPDVKSINALSFGPEGILFIGDSQNASVYAFDTKDTAPAEATKDLKISSFDEKVAELLGTTADQITIQDLAVNPISKNIYFAVQHTNGTPLLMKVRNGEISSVSLKNVSYSASSLIDAVAVDAKDTRGRELRKWAISDLNYSNGKVMVTGLSNQEFGSTFRAVDFPFTENQMMSSLEIYHAAHGQYETNSPVKAFTTTTLEGKDYVVASYTCTPLVIFPTSDFKAGQHVKGRTVAELGSWNTPLDMIVMEKEGKSYLLLANSSRALMKIDLSDVSSYSGSLTEPIEDRGGTAGVDFIALPFVNVLQLDKLSEEEFVMLQRTATGDLQLYSSSNRWF